MSLFRQPSTDSNFVRGRERAKPLLSVVLLSTGSRGDLERAIGVLAPVIRAVRGQVVVVREELLPALLQSHVDAGYVTYLRVPRGTERDGMAEAAMSVVKGDIVAIREDLSVRDAEWLAPYRQALHLDDVLADRGPTPRMLSDTPADLPSANAGIRSGQPPLLEGTSGA